MFDLLSIRLGWRFTRSRKGGSLSRFMSVASIAGIAIGVAALIIGLSAMNGFEKELHDRVLSIIPSATLTATSEGFKNSENDVKKIASLDGVAAVSAGLMLNAVIKNQTSFAPVQILGIKENSVIGTNMRRFIVEKEQQQKRTNPKLPGLIIGSGIADKLKLSLGAVATVLSGSNIENANGNEVEIVGIFNIGGQTDSLLCYSDLKDALEFSEMKYPNVLMITALDLLKAKDLAYKAQGLIDQRVRISSWTDLQGKLYNDIQMIRAIMYLAMILVMAVACFNIVSNLVMAVAERRREIAVLKTIGASNLRIIGIFTLSGLFSGMRGTVIGTFTGCIISVFLTPAMRFIENAAGFKFLNKDVYFIDFIPSELSVADVSLVIVTALLMSTVASLYPAWKASRIEPAQELNV